ncbi:hypothetical protein EDL98_10365 [Ornithobacterium rhinotracheale]|nr:hypothetical protein [Ornithobacterium rhinotracheale]
MESVAVESFTTSDSDGLRFVIVSAVFLHATSIELASKILIIRNFIDFVYFHKFKQKNHKNH